MSRLSLQLGHRCQLLSRQGEHTVIMIGPVYVRAFAQFSANIGPESEPPAWLAVVRFGQNEIHIEPLPACFQNESIELGFAEGIAYSFPRQFDSECEIILRIAETSQSHRIGVAQPLSDPGLPFLDLFTQTARNRYTRVMKEAQDLIRPIKLHKAEREPGLIIRLGWSWPPETVDLVRLVIFELVGGQRRHIWTKGISRTGWSQHLQGYTVEPQEWVPKLAGSPQSSNLMVRLEWQALPLPLWLGGVALDSRASSLQMVVQ